MEDEKIKRKKDLPQGLFEKALSRYKFTDQQKKELKKILAE
jgi:hypothetical protein